MRYCIFSYILILLFIQIATVVPPLSLDKFVVLSDTLEKPRLLFSCLYGILFTTSVVHHAWLTPINSAQNKRVSAGNKNCWPSTIVQLQLLRPVSCIQCSTSIAYGNQSSWFLYLLIFCSFSTFNAPLTQGSVQALRGSQARGHDWEGAHFQGRADRLSWAELGRLRNRQIRRRLEDLLSQARKGRQESQISN